jgi:HEAT repeats
LARKWFEDLETLKFVRDRAVNDKDYSTDYYNVKSTAIKILAEKWPKDPETLILIKDRLVNDNNNYVRNTALEILAGKLFEDPETLKLVRDRAVNDKDYSTKLYNVRNTGILFNLSGNLFTFNSTNFFL